MEKLNQLSYYQDKILGVLVIIACVGFLALMISKMATPSEFRTKIKATPYGLIENNRIYIVIIENHEYFYFDSYGGSLTHKADCKFCMNKTK